MACSQLLHTYKRIYSVLGPQNTHDTLRDIVKHTPILHVNSDT